MTPGERQHTAGRLREISRIGLALITELEANRSTRQVLAETCASVSVLAEVLAAVLEDQTEGES